MLFKTHGINVDILKDVTIITDINFSTNDRNTAELLINIKNQGEALDLSKVMSVRSSFKKPDGKIMLQQDCEPVDASKGKYKILLKTQTLAAAGNVIGQIHIHIEESDQILDTQKFMFSVTESLSSKQALESTNEFGIIQKIIVAGEKLQDVDIEGILKVKETAEDAKTNTEKNSESIKNLGIETAEFKEIADAAKLKSENNAKSIMTLEQEVEKLKTNGGGSGGNGGGFIFEDLIEGEPIGIKPPDNVTNLLATNIKTTEVTLTWDASKSNTVKDYRIYKGDVLLGNTSNPTFTIRELISSTQYTFTVKTRDIYDIESAGQNTSVSTL